MSLKIYDDTNTLIETRKVKFTRSNIDRIAYAYGARVVEFSDLVQLKRAKLTDGFDRMIIIEESFGRT